MSFQETAAANTALSDERSEAPAINPNSNTHLSLALFNASITFNRLPSPSPESLILLLSFRNLHVDVAHPVTQISTKNEVVMI